MAMSCFSGMGPDWSPTPRLQNMMVPPSLPVLSFGVAWLILDCARAKNNSPSKLTCKSSQEWHP